MADIQTPHSLDTTTFSDAAALTSGTVTQRVGSAILISTTAAANVTLTLWNGGTVIVTPAQDTIYPLQVSNAVVNSGTVHLYNLYR
jgi:hypothetical protein